MEIHLVFAMLGIIIVLGFIGDLVFRRTNIPDVVWLIFFGALIGPGLGLVSSATLSAVAPIFTTFALIFILFEGALHLKIKEIFKGVYRGSTLALVNYIVSVIVVGAIALFFGFTLIQSLVLGAILGGTSSAVVIPIMKKINTSKPTVSSLTVESAVSDVLCIVGTLAILKIHLLGSLNVPTFLNGLFDVFVVSLFIGAVAGFLWLKLLKKLNPYAKSYMITIAFMLLLFSFTEYVGSNGAMACLAYGLVLGNSRKVLEAAGDGEVTGPTIKAPEMFFYEEISFLVKTFFFVYIGILLPVTSILPYLIAGVIVVALYLARPISTMALGDKFNFDERAIVDSLIPKGLAAAVLVQVAAQDGIGETALLSSVVMATILISILASTIFVFLAERKKFNGLTNIYRRKIFKKEDAPFCSFPQKDSQTKGPAPSEKLKKPADRPK
jgi:cell volume regulation protein A